MKKLLFLTISFLLTLSGYGTDKQLDSLLNVLDHAIKERHVYADKKKIIIKELEHQAANTIRDDARFFIYAQLFEEYKNFQMDSAL